MPPRIRRPKTKADNEHHTNQQRPLQASAIADELSGNNIEQAAKKNSEPVTRSGLHKKSRVSARKIEANRQNALKSTGPRTDVGKRTVARNALKHGFFSKYLLITDPDGKEDPAEYQDQCAALCEHYQPLTVLEVYWVEKISALTWRLRRLIRVESGQIARALAEHRHEIKQAAEDSEELELKAVSSSEIDSITDHLFLPSKEESDKLLRYEVMFNKQLNHATAELERLQSRRNAD